MIRNYLKVAIRNMIKHKSYVLINMFGLGIAVACAIAAYVLIAYNIEFDDYHEDERVANIFRLHQHQVYTDGSRGLDVGAPLPLGPMAAADISGINRVTRYARGSASISSDDDSFNEEIAFADANFFEVFEFPLISGSHQSFKDISTILITRETAAKYFRDSDPLGKLLTVSLQKNLEKQVIVGGLIDDIPVNSSMTFAGIIRLEHFEELRLLDETPWADWNVPTTYVELVDVDQKENIEPLFDKYLSLRNEAKTDREVTHYSLEPFKSAMPQHLIRRFHINPRVSPEPLVVFIILGVMIMLIACFNLTNTSIAMAAKRLKEIGIRKSVGAHKLQIAAQFLIETTLTLVLSVVVGIAITNIIVPEFTGMWDTPYSLKDLDLFNLILAVVVIIAGASLISGLYPAFFSSRLKMLTLLKGDARVKGTNMLTRSLLVIQFTISVVVLLGGIVFTQNAKYQSELQLGYDKSSVLTVNIQSKKEYQTMEAEAITLPQIREVSGCNRQVGRSFAEGIRHDGVDYSAQHLGVGKNYFATMGFHFVDGKGFDGGEANLDDEIVVSEEFVKTLNLQGNPIGQRIEVRGNKRRIVGVVEDFVDNLYRSSEPEPIVFYAVPPVDYTLLVVNGHPDNLLEIDSQLENSWRKLFPSKPYLSKLQEEVVLGSTKMWNRNLKRVFFFLTVLGVILSASGIFALATLNLSRRTKEIGIRKALGASVRDVVLLINREFVIILSIAAIFGAVFGFMGSSWIMDSMYAHHVEVTLLPTVFAGLLIFGIGVFTTSVTILKSARANPVDTLRTE